MALAPDSDDFNEPKTDDQTTTPPMMGTMGPSPNPVIKALKAVKGAKIKPPSTLASQIAKSRRAHQGSRKWGV